ncbi:MAG: FecR domain-containing protein [Balneolaceae bacterium]|nr:FecR domain-containing protein [Balneolaceae bacterium]
MSKYEKEIEELLADDTFIAWIEGRASDEDTLSWEAWLADDPLRNKLVEQARKLHYSIGFKAVNRPEIEVELDRLRDRIEKDKKSTRPTVSPQDKIINMDNRRGYSRVAAIVLLLVVALSALTMYSLVEVQADQPNKQKPVVEFISTSTQGGQKKVLSLSDGSTITLNANSSLRYPTKYSGGDLEVWLKGEAFFDIIRKTGNEARSFTVNIPQGKVRVLGTQFNVNTYEEGTEVVLVEGKVSVEMTDSLSHVKDTYVMHPGEMSHICRSKQLILSEPVKANLYTAWTQDKLIFQDTTLDNVAKRIAQIYGVEFELNGTEMENIKVSGSLPNNNLEVFLNALQDMLDRPVEFKNGLIVLGEKHASGKL